MANKFMRALRRSRLPAIMITCALVVSLLTLSLTAKNTYIIKDGSETTIVESYFLDSEEALERAGIDLGPLDSYTGSENGSVSIIDIKRAVTVSVKGEGLNSVLVASQGDTVRDVLSRLELEPENIPNGSLQLSDEVSDGMVINLTSAHLKPMPEHLIRDSIVQAAAESEEAKNALLRIEADCLKPNGLLPSPFKNSAAAAGNSDGSTALSSVPEAAAADNVNSATIPGPGYKPANDPEAAHEYGAGITCFLDENCAAEKVWSFDDKDGWITTATGETVHYSRIVHVSATAYTTESAYNKITATGSVARVGAIAVDPTVIPYGTRMYVVSEYGNWIYGYATAEDCGGGIKGHKVDLFFDTYDECIQFGVRNAQIYILDSVTDGK